MGVVFTKLRSFYRVCIAILRKVKQETRLFRKSVREVLEHLIERGIQIIQLKYHCLQVRKRMCSVRTYTEWESYARLLDHLEGTVDWKYIEHSDFYDYERLERRRQMMKQLRTNQNIKTLTFCVR